MMRWKWEWGWGWGYGINEWGIDGWNEMKEMNGESMNGTR